MSPLLTRARPAIVAVVAAALVAACCLTPIGRAGDSVGGLAEASRALVAPHVSSAGVLGVKSNAKSRDRRLTAAGSADEPVSMMRGVASTAHGCSADCGALGKRFSLRLRV